MISGIVEIGRELAGVKERFGEHRDGRYTEFVTKRLGWSMSQARNFLSVYEMFERANFARSDLDALTIPTSSLYLIAAPSTPIQARDAALEKAATPGGISREEVETLIATARG